MTWVLRLTPQWVEQEGAANDPRNVVTEAGNGLEPRGLVTLYKQRNGRRKAGSCMLTGEGERVSRLTARLTTLKPPWPFAPRLVWARAEAPPAALVSHGNPSADFTQSQPPATGALSWADV